MKAKFLVIVTAIATVSAFAPTSAFSRGSAASQEKRECESKCNVTGAPPTPQIQACYKKCDTKSDSKTTK